MYSTYMNSLEGVSLTSDIVQFGNGMIENDLLGTLMSAL